ncbi:MAG: D-2-hydroxyacid dehydrogenase [Clostridia bacterium]|nr:D-2-hydroxyacid dehydrogenase [Clostridia bacterium]
MKLVVFEWESVCGTDLDPSGLKAFGDVKFYGKPKPEEVAALVGDSEAVICSKVAFTREVMEACPHLSYIGVMATGYNNIDTTAAKERGIAVTNVPDYSSDAVCQMTLAFILQFATSLIRYDASTRKGDWTRSPLFCYYPYSLTELKGKTLGLFGLGSIGKKVAKVADALGMRVIYHARTKKDVPYTFCDRETLFRESDYLSLHAPSSAETQGLVNKEMLGLMKQGAYLINTARGDLVVEEDVAKALKSGKLGGFAADVLSVEPQRADCPLLGLENCIFTPHIAWAPTETRARLWDVLLKNLEAWCKGAPENVVNP